MGVPVRVTVDAWKCQSHLKCVAAAPELFRYDEEHSYTVAGEGEVLAEFEEAAKRAISLCPEGAITSQGGSVAESC